MQPRVFSLYLTVASLLVLPLMLSPPVSLAQEEVASALRRYKDKELSTGYYEEYEVRPRRQRPFVEIPGVSISTTKTDMPLLLASGSV